MWNFSSYIHLKTVKKLGKEGCRLVNLGVLQWLISELIDCWGYWLEKENTNLEKNSPSCLDLVKKLNKNTKKK